MEIVETGLVDADSIYFRAAFSNTSKKEMRLIINRTMREIETAITAGGFAVPDLLVAVKGRGNFRKELYPEYKMNRPELAPEIKEALNYGHNYMKEEWNAQESTGMEADDLVAIWAKECRDMERSYTVVGIDKDLLQIPGKHYNFKRQEHRVVSEEEAYMLLMQQCLTGDTSDNIPGIKGIGPKKASKILTGIPRDRLWNRVRAAWRGTGSGDPELSRRLLTMLTSWEEYEEIRASLQSETPQCEQDVCKEGEDNVQDSGLPSVPGGDQG